MPLATEVVLHRSSEGGPYQIGVSSGAEHALGWLRPHIRVVRKRPGDWVFVDPETEEEHRDTSILGDKHWQQFLADYPLTLIRNLVPNSVRNGIWGSLVFRLVLRGVREPTTWTLEGDVTGLRLADDSGQTRADIDAEDWWYAREEEWMQALADELVERTGLKPLSGDDLIDHFQEPDEE